MNRFSLRDKTVLITGAAGILGQRFVKAFLEQGAIVVGVDRNSDALSQLSLAVNNNTRLHTKQGDITDKAFLVEVDDWIRDAHGKLDVLFNNAATKSENFFEPFETFSAKEWNEVFDVNVNAAMYCCQVFGSEMAKAGAGSIINTLSIYGIVAPDQRIYDGSEYLGRAINTPAVYSASKAALWGLTRYLASYWGHAGVRVNAITPGGIFSGQNDTFVGKYSARIPLGRMAKADEMLGAAIFLASDESSYVTGQNIVVDGGLTVW